MKEPFILFFNNPYGAARQYALSYKLLYALGSVVVGAFLCLGLLYYLQHREIVAQQEVLKVQKKEIDGFSKKESRIVFLESYLDELKRSSYQSELALKKHTVRYQNSMEKLQELHGHVCKIMSVECVEQKQGADKIWAEAEKTVQWMEKVGANLETLAQTVTDFNIKKTTIEDQQKTIAELEQRIAQTDAQLAKHLELVQSKEKAITQISEKIHKVTGIPINLSEKYIEKIPATEGRGGPSVQEFSLAPDDELGRLRQYLEASNQYYDNVTKSFEGFNKSVSVDTKLWQHTPTTRPLPKSRISDPFGRRTHPVTKKPDFHRGVDFVARRGTPIYAPASGVVTRAGYGGGYGRVVEINHGEGFYKEKQKKVNAKTRYGHLHRIKVKKGQKVKRGDVLGTVGSTGISTGPHLHYEVIVNNKHINPMSFINHFESLFKNRR